MVDFGEKISVSANRYIPKSVREIYEFESELDVTRNNEVMGKVRCRQSVFGNRVIINFEECLWDHISFTDQLWNCSDSDQMYTFEINDLKSLVAPIDELTLSIPVMNGGKIQNGKAIVSPVGVIIISLFDDTEFEDGMCGLVNTSLSWLA